MNNNFDRSKFVAASSWSAEGLQLFFVLLFSISPVEMTNQGTWQKIWASSNDHHLRWGLGLAVLLIFPTVTVFGFLGIVAVAAGGNGVDLTEPLNSSLAFFTLLIPLGFVWLCFVGIMAMALVTSSVDSIQQGMASLISSSLMKNKLSINWSRLASLIFSIPFVAFALYLTRKPTFSIITLFLIADLVAATVAPGILLGMWDRTTPLGALIGSIAALGIIPIWGWASTGTFIGGFEIFSLPKGFSALETLWIFIAVPLVATVVTIFVSAIDGYYRPYLIIEKRTPASIECTPPSPSIECPPFSSLEDPPIASLP
eukprot:GHVL01022036.1.p1 GENE.GHVL01022036.1~~GHVL01022036.1.p1  ORF type:complete len:314 (+),score=39.56 GHVL01022036.1:728-1669(+)